MFETAHDLHQAPDEASLRRATPGIVIEACGMGRWMRQIWVVIGLTVILTFPVTVISGAGSQKHPHHHMAVGAVGGQGTGSSHGGYQMQGRGRSTDAEPPRR